MSDDKATESGGHGADPGAPARRGIFTRRVHPPASTTSAHEKTGADSVTIQEPEKETEVKPVSFTELFRFSTRFELCLDFVGIICAAAAGAAQPLMSLLFGNLTQDFVEFEQAQISGGNSSIIDDAKARFTHNASTSAAALTYMGLGIFVTTFVYMYTWVYTAEVNAKRIRERYLTSILRQDIAYFDNVGAGEVATRIQTDTHLVQQGMSEKVPLVANFLAAFVTGFVLAFVRNWRLALALSSVLPCIAITGAIMSRFISKYMQLSLKYVAEGGSLAEEVISTVRTAHAFGTQKILSKLYDTHVDRADEVDHKAAIMHGGGMSVFFFIVYASYALAFSFGTTLINEGHANAGQVVNVFMAILTGSFSLVMLAPEMQAITHGRGAAAKLFATIDRVPPIDSASPEGLQLASVAGALTLENVSFNYPSRPDVPVVTDLSLSFPAGKMCALVGASGSGKSTVVSLVERFYDPAAGTVRLDGVNLRELNVRWLRAQIGLVSQEPTLFATTIRGNVAHGLIGTRWEDADEAEKDARIREACVKANADGFISKLPNGYETMVGERGFLLSGGQKQRIAIARAIVSDPKILLLDEATSALDTRSEGVVQDALDKASEGRTTITVAHRLSTIRDADCIFVMGNGRVLEKGTHQELLKDADGAYARLVAAQKLREAEKSHEAEMETDIELEEASGTVDSDDYSETAKEKLSLRRTNTTHTVASEIIKNKEQEMSRKRDDDLTLVELFKRMGAINHSAWKMWGFGTIFCALSGAVYPCFGIVFAKGINAFSQTDPHERRIQGDRTALYFFVIALASLVTIGMQHFLFASAAGDLTAKLRKLSFRAVLRQDIVFFDKQENSTGSLVSSLSEDPQKVNGLAGVTLAAIFQAIFTLITGTVLGVVFAWKIGLVGFACAPLLISTGYIRLRVVVLKDKVNKQEHEQSAQLACEAAGAIRTVASLTREQDCARIYSESLDAPLQKSKRTAIPSNLLYAISQASSYFIIALVFWYGATLVAAGEFTTFDFFVGLMSTTFGAIQTGSAFSFVPDISSAQSAGSAILRLLDARPEIDAETTEGKAPTAVSGQVRFEGVHFRYPTRIGVPVLRGLSLTVEPGTYVALVGASGCGKSTTVQLIERFYDPLAGHVYLDGQDITEFNVQEYRKYISLVSQEPTLYAGTLRFNILLGAIKPESEVTQAEIEEACRKANILDFIHTLPEGFDTQVGGKGNQLSGGQKQRIAIARALLRNPKVLLLDEATSALDSNSEKVVQEALDQAAKGRTTIAIAHRLSTIQNADCIYFIQDGTVLESGTHDQLIDKKGAYFEYVQLQTLSNV